MFRHVLFPAALPQIFVGLRLSAGVAVLMMVGVEFVPGQRRHRLPHLVLVVAVPAPQMYVGIVGVALMGLAAHVVVKWISLLVLPWARDEITRRRPHVM